MALYESVCICQEAPGLGAAPGPGPGVPRILTVESPPPPPAQDKKVTTVLLNSDHQKKKTSTPKINPNESVLLLYIDI